MLRLLTIATFDVRLKFRLNRFDWSKFIIKSYLIRSRQSYLSAWSSVARNFIIIMKYDEVFSEGYSYHAFLREEFTIPIAEVDVRLLVFIRRNYSSFSPTVVVTLIYGREVPRLASSWEKPMKPCEKHKKRFPSNTRARRTIDTGTCSIDRVFRARLSSTSK